MGHGRHYCGLSYFLLMAKLIFWLSMSKTVVEILIKHNVDTIFYGEVFMKEFCNGYFHKFSYGWLPRKFW